MISFDLKCAGSHVFEAWFRSSEDFERQQREGLLLCPTCGSVEVGKAVMAPAVAPKGNQRPVVQADSDASREGPSPEQLKAMLEAIAQAQAEAIKSSSWVGDDFANQARAMYYGDAEHAPIHGRTSPREARELMEEGLPVAPLIIPIAPPDQTN